jgi:hypothetical protein
VCQPVLLFSQASDTVVVDGVILQSMVQDFQSHMDGTTTETTTETTEVTTLQIPIAVSGSLV